MYKLKGNTIYLVRGDTLETQVTIKRSKDEEYIPVEGDVVRFALKRDQLNHSKTQYVDDQPLVIKTIPINTLVLRLDPSDTSSLDFGVYAYDIQLTMADGKVDTFISDKLYLEPEVF